MPSGRPKAKKPPRGAASPHSGRSVGVLFAAGPPQGKKAPSGGSKPAQRAQRGGLFLPPGRPKAKKPPRGAASPHSGRSVGAFFCRRAAPRQKSPLGGQQARTAGAAWGLFLRSPHHRPQVPSPTGTDTVLAVNRSWRTAVCLSRRGQAPAAGAACGVAAMPALTRRSRPARAFP
ncbi:hypothetical protein AZ21_2138 [Bordetella bronchiseptica B20-10725633]|nr:hypothetical protein AZ21_2138 [Bordetella bronchiseptica B20-10725633]